MTEEDLIQESIVKAVKLFYPKDLIFAVPNGGYRTKTNAKTLKRTGTTAGVADLIFLFNGKTIFIEVKTTKGVLSDSQKEFKKIVENKGHKYWVIKSAHEMLQRIKDYLY